MDEPRTSNTHFFQWSFLSREQMSPKKLTCSQLCGFIAHLVEHCTGIAEVIGSNPVGTTWIFQVSRSQTENCLNCPDNCEDQSLQSCVKNPYFKYTFLSLIINPSQPTTDAPVAHVRVAACLSFKVSPGAQPFKWKLVAYSYANQTHFPYNSYNSFNWRLTSKTRQMAWTVGSPRKKKGQEPEH